MFFFQRAFNLTTPRILYKEMWQNVQRTPEHFCEIFLVFNVLI
jgi:hypothetical protein